MRPKGEAEPLPPEETCEAIYSNWDRVLDASVERILAADPSLYAQHAACNYCGYVWCKDGVWYEQVWQWKTPVELFTGPGPRAVIEAVIGKYGSA